MGNLEIKNNSECVVSRMFIKKKNAEIFLSIVKNIVENKSKKRLLKFARRVANIPRDRGYTPRTFKQKFSDSIKFKVIVLTGDDFEVLITIDKSNCWCFKISPELI